MKRGAWAVVEQGIYFIVVERSEALVAEGFLKFFHFDTGRVTRIASLGEQLATTRGQVQVAVSPTAAGFFTRKMTSAERT